MAISQPLGTVQGDLLLATISARGNRTITPPNGWTLVLRQANGSAETLAVYYRLADATDSSVTSYSFTLTAANPGTAAGAILRYTGANPLVPIDASAFDTGTNNAPTAPSVTTNVADTTVVRIAGIGDNTLTQVPPTSRFTPINYNPGGNGNDVALGVGDANQAAAGSTGLAAFTSGNDAWVAATVVLRSDVPVCAAPGRDGSPTNLSGTVNTYYPGTSTASAGAASISVGTSTGDTSKSIASGDLLLVIQMQDAAINSTNTSSYGDGVAGDPGSGATNYNSAGLYEFVRATGPVSGGSVPIQGTGVGLGLGNTYTNANATVTQGQRRFQVVRVPQYDSPTVTGQITAPAWNGSTGGIVAVDAAGTLTFSGGSVNVNALGFRGGGGQLLGGGTGANTDYRTRVTVNTNGNKAEGVAGSPNFMYDGTGTLAAGSGYPDGTNADASRARGAPGNAGGGGTDGNPANNDQNSGGGGGGNGGAGGTGGNTWSSNLPRGGFGGAAFPHAASRLAMGGGGASGSRNNTPENLTASSGGRGGGMIIVRANSVAGTATLTANGGVGVTPANDGGGGGGAGGSVLVFARTGVLTSLTINANGANGTNADPTGSAHGPGGGGAGGVLYLSSSAGSTSVAGGANGTTTTSAIAFNATPGAAGAANTALAESQIPGVCSGATCKATLASVSRFGATVEGGQVLLTWETAFELGTAGFHVERLDPILGDYERVNDELLPALITSPQGGSYSYVDPGAWPGQGYSYRLVEQEVWGGTRTHGPFTVTPAEPARALARAVLQGASPVIESDQGIDDPERGYRAVAHGNETGRNRQALAFGVEDAGVAQGAQAAVLAASLSSDSLQIPVHADGLYYASAADLARVLARTEAAVVRWIKRAELQLTTGGRDVAWMPAAGNAGIYFYGEPIDSLYTLDNLYRVRVAQVGVRMKGSPVKETAPAPMIAGSFADTLWAEQDRFAATVVSTDPGSDYWYWDGFIGGGIAGWSAKSFTIQLPNVTGDGLLRVFLKGAGLGAHPVSVSINGHPLGGGSWEGLTGYELRLPVTASQLQSGDNLVEVRALGGTENMFYLDRIAVQYRRLARAVGDRLTLNAEFTGPLGVDGFTSGDIHVFDITDPKTPRHLTAVTLAPGAVGQGVTFNAKLSARYLALSSAAIPAAAPVSMTAADLQLATDQVEYLVIAPPGLRDAAQQLADYRQTKGLSSRVVGTDEIYDSFNWGIASPEALREFLRHVSGTWGVRYVVLVGMGSLDYRDLGGRGEPQAPTLMTSTPNGLFGCDNCLVDFDGDGAPDVAIGRIPAANEADLQVYLAKVGVYEEGTVPLPQAGATLLAGKSDPEAGYFSRDSDWVAELLPSGTSVSRIYLDQYVTGTARSLLFAAMNQGTGWVNYLGHGGIDRFGDSQALLTSDDMGTLQSTGPLPVVSALTCAANRFEIPGYAALGEELVLDADGGAIAVWAPTGLSLNKPAVQLNRSLFDAVYQQRAPTLGEAVQQALWDNRRRDEVPAFMLRLYSLLGDPALELRY